MLNKTKITIEDVAKEAKVSISTVSRVINNNYPVSKETRAKVEDAIKKLEFNPSMLARSLIVKKTNTLGIVVPSLVNMFFSMVVKGIENVCKVNNYTILLSDSEGNAEDEIKCIKSLLSRQVDGIIVADPVTENMLSCKYDEIFQMVPLVFINGYSKDNKFNFVLNDESDGTVKALEYLISLGHTDIAFIRGNKSYSYDIKEEVYKRMMSNMGFPIYEYSIINIGEGNSVETMDNTADIIYSMLLKGIMPTAFFACNDIMAIGALNACKRMGIIVPDQVSIVGFDNIIISELSEPKITTVDQNMFELGKSAAKMLMDILDNNENEEAGRKIVLNTELKIRGSCSSPRHYR